MADFMNNPLLLTGLGILSQSGQRGQIGKGALAGLGMYNQNRMNMQDQAFRERQFGQTEQMNAMRMQQLKQQMGQKAAQRAAQQRLLGLMGGTPQVGAGQPGMMPGAGQPNMQDVMSAYPDVGKQMLMNKLMPQQPKPTDDIREYNFAKEQGYQGSFYDFITDVKSAGSTKIDLRKQQLPTTQEIQREDLLSRAGDARKFNAGILTEGFESQKRIGDYEKAINLLDDVQTGPFEENLVKAKRVAGRLGIDVDWNNIGSAEELRVLLGNEVMSRVAETKGAVSEREMQLFTDYSANFGNTSEGNKRILAFKKSKAKRDAHLAKMVRRMQKQNKTSLQIREAVENYVFKNDISDTLQNPVPQAAPQAGGWSIRKK